MVFSDNNFQEFPKIGSDTHYWIKLLLIIGNYCPKENKPLAATPKRELPSAMDYKKQISIIRLILSTNYNDRN